MEAHRNQTSGTLRCPDCGVFVERVGDRLDYWHCPKCDKFVPADELKPHYTRPLGFRRIWPDPAFADHECPQCGETLFQWNVTEGVWRCASCLLERGPYERAYQRGYKEGREAARIELWEILRREVQGMADWDDRESENED